MKMLLIVFREAMAEQVHALLKEYEITGFTEIHNVAGKGETGSTVHFALSAGANRMILTALPEQVAFRLIDVFTRHKTEHLTQKMEGAFPLHVFVLPCEQAV